MSNTLKMSNKTVLNELDTALRLVNEHYALLLNEYMFSWVQTNPQKAAKRIADLENQMVVHLHDINALALSILCLSVRNIGLTIRACGCLEEAQLLYIVDLVQKTEPELKLIPGIGEKVFNEIRRLLTTRNLRLGMKFDQALINRVHVKIIEQELGAPTKTP